MNTYKRGSNQYKRKPKGDVMLLFWVFIAIVGAVTLGMAMVKKQAHIDFKAAKVAYAYEASLSARTRVASPSATPTPTIVMTPEKREIEVYVKEVFGKYADQALMIAKCESGLRPNAVGTNKDGSQDFGLFQLNSYWHGFNKGVNNSRHLFDYKINTLMAWNIFEGSGYKWGLWVCSGKVGLK